MAFVQLEARLHDMKRQGATMVEERGELQEQVKEGKSRVERLTKEEEACRRRIGELRARCEEYKQSLAAASSRSAMLTKLLAARKRGGELQGVSLHGRLGDLGTIPAKYDVAASTAVRSLEWLVVDTTEDGQKCVDFLRKHRLGRAKFIILDKIAWVQQKMAQRASFPEGVPRLFDMVTPSHPR